MAITPYDKNILSKFRSRTFFEEYFGDLPNGKKQFIRSEGSYKITIKNAGQTAIELTDGAGSDITLQPGVPFAGSSSEIILGGDPRVVLDDIIEFDFGGAGRSWMLVIYERIVLKKDDDTYTIEQLMQEEK